MKKLNLNIKGFVFTTLLVSVIFCGCDEAKPNKEPTKIGVGIEYRGYNISTIEYDGHDYIMCAGGNGGGGGDSGLIYHGSIFASFFKKVQNAFDQFKSAVLMIDPFPSELPAAFKINQQLFSKPLF